MSQRTLSESPYLNSNLFSTYFLDERIHDLDQWECDEEAEAALVELTELYEEQDDLVDAYDEDNLRTDWIDPVLSILGHRTISETPLPDTGGFIDRLLFDSNDARVDAVHLRDDGQHRAVYGRGMAILEAKQWDADFEDRFHEHRSYRDASHQIKYYLERTPDSIQWGILTNGRKWRLYGTRDYETQTYYEIDFPELIASGNVERFKYFFAFFRSAAFAKIDGASFLDQVWAESETAAQELGSDLQDNVFTALRVLGEGFVESNDLDIKPGDEEALRELKEQSLVLLYRLMFVLYAESRGLIHPDSPRAEREYASNFSIDDARIDIHEAVSDGTPIGSAFSTRSTQLWSRLSDLFRLIDQGDEELGIPAYNGGLFDREEHAFLTENSVSDRYIAEVIHRLSTTSANGGMVLADYADIDTRHLGSIYEGLLEHQFRLAGEDLAAVREEGVQVWKSASEVSEDRAIEKVDRGQLYVVNDEGERKATGAYYTPDYIVTYIVEETIGPLLEGIREDLLEEGFEPGNQEYVFQLGNRVLDLKVLDPAMGSGHFLTKATGYLAEQVQEAAREAEIEDVMREEQVRRQVAKEVIYGVDINAMAVELAKLSMWLETLAADQPLAFLDHHLKVGNSIVGSDIEAIEGLQMDAGEGDQSSLADFGAVRQGTIEHLLDVYQEFLSIENENLDDIKAMERKYAEIEQDSLRNKLVAMANVHTAEAYGIELPSGAYERMARSLDDEGEWKAVSEKSWFTSSQEIAREENFFHWKLEFPEVFYDMAGKTEESDGFDAIVGNPPYVSNWNLTEANPSLVDALDEIYDEVTVGHWDLYIPFCKRSLTLLAPDGRHSFIISNSIGTEKYGRRLREEMVKRYSIDSLVRFNSNNVFAGVNRMVIVYVVQNSEPASSILDLLESEDGLFELKGQLPQEKLEEFPDYSWRLDISESDLEIKEKMEESEICLGHLCWVNPGIVAHSAADSPLDFHKEDVVMDSPTEGAKQYVAGGDVNRHYVDWKGEYIDYDKYREHFHRPKHPLLFESPKIMFSDVSGEENSIKSCYDDSGYYTNHTVNHATKWTSDTEELKGPSDYTPLDIVEEYDLKFLAGVVNSSLMSYYFSKFLATKTLQSDRTRMHPEEIRSLPITDITSESANSSRVQIEMDIEGISPSSPVEAVANLTEAILEFKKEKGSLNLHLPDYLGNYSEGPSLREFEGYQPPDGVANTILAETTETHGNLRIGHVETKESDGILTVLATARYKPEDEDSHDTDQWGYTETEPIPALEFHGLERKNLELIREFVLYATEEGGGFANYRETATKTNSLIDRLGSLTLPDPSDVENGMSRFLETKTQADDLDSKIKQVDEKIDNFVFELYGLTENEIEIVGQTEWG